MKYSITRKINLSRFFPEMQFENIDFAILEANTPEEANTELNNWINEWLKSKGYKPKKDPFEFQKSLGRLK